MTSAKHSEEYGCLVIGIMQLIKVVFVFEGIILFESIIYFLIFLVVMRLGVTPVPIPNTMVKT